LDILKTDSWGNLHVAIEINTGKNSLIRIFRKDLLNRSDFAEFIRHVSDLNFNLQHENILPLEEVVRGPGGQIGFIHPFYPTTLDKLIVNKEGCMPDERFELGLQIIKAMSYAHNHKGGNGKVRRIFHLHLQPALILADDACKTLAISCLGYSLIYRNLTRAKQPRWQEPGMNPAVMPPEFFKTKPAPIKERSADIYCLGVVLYYLFTGEFPFEGPSLDDYKFQHTKIFAAPPRLINASVPDWLEPIILGCLEKEPDKRWETVDEILDMYDRTSH
jgi:serine/threonine-protein kinase